MQIMMETKEEQEKRLSQWQKWFAWRPVIVYRLTPRGTPSITPGYRVWLEYVERRMNYYKDGNKKGQKAGWQYRLINKA